MNRKTPPELHGIGDLTLAKPRQIILDNGMPLIVLDSRVASISRLTAICEGGTADASSPVIPAIAAVVQTEGTPSMDAAAIAAAIDYNGAAITVSALSHHMRTQMRALPERFHDVLPIMVDTIFNAALPTVELRTVRRRLSAAARLRQEKVDYRASVLSARATFGEEHPLAREITDEAVMHTTRRQLAAFRQRFVRPDRMHLFLTGTVTPGLIEDINRTFGSVPVPENRTRRLQMHPFIPSAERWHADLMHGTRQAAIEVTIPTIGRDNPDYLDLRLAVSALGGYFGSRLQSSIREDKGLTYGIGSQLLGYSEGGIANIQTQCDNANVHSVVDSIRRELRRLACEPPTDSEMQRMAHTEFTSLLEAAETPFSAVDFHITLLTAHLPDDYFERRVAAARSITSGKIARLAATYLDPERMIVAVAGDLQ